jgi:hypothetical protein
VIGMVISGTDSPPYRTYIADMRQIFEEIHRVTTMVPSIPDGESSAPGLSMDLVTLAHGLFSAHTPKIKLLSKGRVVLSLCSSQHWAAKAPPFKVELRLNPSQSKAATDTGSSRNATTPFCEVAKFQRNNVSTKKTQRQIDSHTIGRVYTRAVQGRMVVVARHPTSSQLSLDVILTVSGGRQWSEHQMRRTKGYEDVATFKVRLPFETRNPTY